MLRRVIYTLYIVSKERKIGDDFLISGGSVFFLIFINFITLLAVVFWLMKKSFGAFFVEYEYLFLGVTLICFFLSQLYARYIVKNIEKRNAEVKKLQPVSILFYGIVSVIFLLLSMTLL
jgi:uncharacterized membrane protein (DUF485 family)